MKIREGLTFDDVLLVPQPSPVLSRSMADTKAALGGLVLATPFVSANMDTVTGLEMAFGMQAAGGQGILHRYASHDKILGWCENINKWGWYPIPSVGLEDCKDKDYLKRLAVHTKQICLDIAHAGLISAPEAVERLIDAGFVYVIAGNVATSRTALPLLEAGASVIKVGIGPGSVCQTRSVTGHGVPQLTAIMDVASLRDSGEYTFQIIADGGFNQPGDMVKALAAGADTVMSGKFFAGCDECPKHGIYRGMASNDARNDFGSLSQAAPEGLTVAVKSKGPVAKVVEHLAAALRSGMSYTGALTLSELQNKAEFIRVTPAGIAENGIRP